MYIGNEYVCKLMLVCIKLSRVFHEIAFVMKKGKTIDCSSSRKKIKLSHVFFKYTISTNHSIKKIGKYVINKKIISFL